MIRLLRGHVLDQLATLPDESVHCAITSPPYWSLRDYSLPPAIWDADEGCAHEWGAPEPAVNPRWGTVETLSAKQASNGGSAQMAAAKTGGRGSFCRHCGGWRGQLGLEPTFALYLQHVRTIFREVRRVLRDDATLWLNCGDNYVTTPAGNTRETTDEDGAYQRRQKRNRDGDGTDRSKIPTITGGELPQGNLQLQPHRIALALQEDGWLLRSTIVWSKGRSFSEEAAGSVMPESISGTAWVRHKTQQAEGYLPCPGCAKCAPHGGYVFRQGSGRPTTAHDYVFLFAKTQRYYADMEGVREADGGVPAGNGYLRPHRLTHGPGKDEAWQPGTGRNLRSVWEILDPETRFRPDLSDADWELIRNATEVLASYAAPATIPSPGSVLNLNPEPRTLGMCRICKTAWRSGCPERHCGERTVQHYAAFPAKLVETCLKIGASERGVCATCGAPWARVVDAESIGSWDAAADDDRDELTRRGRGKQTSENHRTSRSLGWRPTCGHAGEPVPATVCDPFSGSGTTLEVAASLGHSGIGIELSEEYYELSLRTRLWESAGREMGYPPPIAGSPHGTREKARRESAGQGVLL